MKRYDGKNAWWFFLILILYNLLPLICFFLSMSPNQPIILYIAFIFYYSFNILFIPICVRNYIELYDDHFLFYYGFSKREVQLTQIRKIEKTHDITASSANSLDRIYIETYGNEFIEDVKHRLEQLR